MNHKVSEIFYSFQGEGKFTGQLTAWVRLFACNLQCPGFGQSDPSDPSTYKFDVINAKSITSLNDLPVIQYGCDSSYSWSAKFKHLCLEYSADEIAHQLVSLVNTDCLRSKVYPHLAFTGGEPLLPKGQITIIDTISALRKMNTATSLNLIKNITIETNGTQTMSDNFINFMSNSGRVFISVSPKLFNVSGETNKKAIIPSNVAQYSHLFSGQLKFVMNNSQTSWNELEQVIDSFREAGCLYPVWVMPVGSSREQQSTSEVTQIAEEAIKRGYNISGRLHSLLLGNGMGK